MSFDAEDWRRQRWLLGATWEQIATAEGVSVLDIVRWAERMGLAPNQPAARVRRGRRRLLQLAMKQFRQTRRDCESRGVPRAQLDALEPFLTNPLMPDPRPALTQAQRATLMALADAHDHVLEAWGQ